MPKPMTARLWVSGVLIILMQPLLAVAPGALAAGVAPAGVGTSPPSTAKAFPDFGFLPADAKNPYKGALFQLSQDYPKQLPSASKVPAFFGKLPVKPFSADFKTWRDYMMAVRSYCFEGNINPNGTLNQDVDWRVEKNGVRKWYHIPWQHYGPNGREGIHGLTKEAPVMPKQLAASQTYGEGQTYAVGFFNGLGGYTIGRVWANPLNPNAAVTTRQSTS